MGLAWCRLIFILGSCASIAAHPCYAENLPIDTTAIDTLVAKLGGSVPFPPESLLHKIEALGGTVNVAIFPEGRSLERRITDYSNPRTIFSVVFRDSKGLTMDSRAVFIAYTPKNHQLQLIGSSNARPFDFRVINNYQAGNKRPQTSRVNPGLCFSCHQGGGAIFPTLPWSETTANENVESMLLNLQDRKHLDPFADSVLGKEVVVGDGFSAAYALNNQINSSNNAEYLNPRKLDFMCKNICGENVECRKVMLIDALLASDNVDPSQLFSNEQSQKMISSLNQSARQDFFTMSQDVLSDRDPFENHAILPGPGNDPLIPRPGTLNFGDLNIFIGAKPADPDSIAVGIASFSALCFNFNADQISALHYEEPDKLASAIQSGALGKLTQDAFWPPSVAKLLRAAGLKPHVGMPSDIFNYTDVVASEQTTQAIDYPAVGSLNRNFNVYMAQRTGGSSIPHHKVTQLYTAYCSSCHSGADSIAPLLPLDDLDALKTYVGAAGRTIKSMLEPPNDIMPPPGSPLMPSAQDRTEMLKAVGDASIPENLAEITNQSCLSDSNANLPSSQAGSLASIQQAANFGICLGCHSGPGPIPPHIPFSEPKTFKDALKSKALYSSSTLYDAIIQRINDPASDPNHMPMGGQLSDDEKKSIRSYLQTLVAH